MDIDICFVPSQFTLAPALDRVLDKSILHLMQHDDTHVVFQLHFKEPAQSYKKTSSPCFQVIQLYKFVYFATLINNGRGFDPLPKTVIDNVRMLLRN